MFYGIFQNYIRHRTTIAHIRIDSFNREQERKRKKSLFCKIRIIKKRYFNKIYCLLSLAVVVDVSYVFLVFDLVWMHKCINDSQRTSSRILPFDYLSSDNIVQPVQLIVFPPRVALECLFASSSGLVEEQSEINICPAGFYVIARLWDRLWRRASRWESS